MKKKILSILMCAVMAFAFAIPISAEGDVELHGVYLRCIKCAGAAQPTKKTNSYEADVSCKTFNHGYSYGYDRCLFTEITTTVHCLSCGHEETDTTTTCTVISCGGYN